MSSTSNDKPDQGYENTIISSESNTSFEQYKDMFASLGLCSKLMMILERKTTHQVL